MNFHRLTKEELKSEFQTIERHFDTFVNQYPEFDKYKMLEDLLQGKSVLWACDSGIVIGRPNHYHNQDIFLIEVLAGEHIETWVDYINVIEDEVRAWGFPEIEFYGRLGWNKMMSMRGFKPIKTVMRKEL